jgi:hypothetical protein
MGESRERKRRDRRLIMTGYPAWIASQLYPEALSCDRAFLLRRALSMAVDFGTLQFSHFHEPHHV